ncbi:MAG: rubrerythrin [Thermoplasmata archaeon HGW-Thermoplasmata-1]|nr:MAG: rubrerythrin [Thermoplasmata archaeon HGW-Thermoplasmata-1]
MMSQIPIDLGRLAKELADAEIARVGMIAELDAVNLYEQMAAAAKDPILKKMLSDIAKEEKTHLGEFEALLLRLDDEQEDELRAGQKEVEEMLE